MPTWFTKLASGVIASVLPMLLIGISSLTAYYFYTTNKYLKQTVQHQERIISDLQDVNTEVRGLYSKVHNRLKEEALRASSDVYGVKSSSGDVLEEKLPKDVLRVLRGRDG